MANLQKRFVWASTAAKAANYIGDSVSSEDKKSVIFAGTDNDQNAVRDIITHGRSFVQDPLNAREIKITGYTELDSTKDGSLAKTAVTTSHIGGQDSVAILTGATNANLRTAIDQLNEALIATDDRLAKASQVELVKAETPEGGWAAQYDLYQGVDADGKLIKDDDHHIGHIDIPKDQFLKNVEFLYEIDATTVADYAGYGLTQGESYLKFTWSLNTGTDSDNWVTSDDTAVTGVDAITFLNIHDLADVYAGSTVKQAASGAVTVHSAGSVAGGTWTEAADTTTTTPANTYEVTVSLDPVPEGTTSNGEGKQIKVTLNAAILTALAKAEQADANAVALATAAKNEVSYNLVGKDTTVFHTLKNKVQTSEEGAEYVEYEQDENPTTTQVLGSTRADNTVVEVADVLNDLGTAIVNNQKEIIDLWNEANKSNAFADSLRVQEKEFLTEGTGSNALRKITLFGDEIHLDQIASDLKDKETTTACDTVKTSDNHELGLKAEDSITSAILKLEAAWEWEEIQ